VSQGIYFGIFFFLFFKNKTFHLIIKIINKNYIKRFEKEELDDACGNKKFPDNCFVELLFLPCDVQKGGHFLETFIPEDLNTKTGTSCYFSDPEQNAKYTFWKEWNRNRIDNRNWIFVLFFFDNL